MPSKTLSVTAWWKVLPAVLLLSTNAAAQQVTLSLAATSPEVGIEKEMIDSFEAAVSEASDGQIILERFFGGVLGGEEETLLAMQAGEIDMSLNSLPGTRCYPRLDVQSVPFLFTELEAIQAYYEGPIRARIEDKVEECGLVLLGFLYRGARWTTADRPIESLEDLEGFKIRLPQWPHSIKVWRELGASPTPIPASEVFSALQTGVVDGHENKLQNIYGRSIWEVNEYLIATRHIQDVLTWVVSKQTWDQLSSEDKTLVREAAEAAITASNESVPEENKNFVAQLKSEGMTVVYPDLEAWRQRALPVIETILTEEFAEEARTEVQSLVDDN